jgi:hypothetical protein
LTWSFRHVIIRTVNYILNLYSILVGKAFAFAYAQGSSHIAPALLEHYRSTRRRLPLMSDGNRMGNHNSYATLPNGKYAKNIFGGYDSWYATQGITPSHNRMEFGKRVKLAYHDYKELVSGKR